MNRRHLFVQAVVFALALGVFLSTAEAQPARSPRPTQARISQITGTVLAGSSRETLARAQRGDRLQTGDWLKCEAGGSAVLDFGDGTVAAASAETLMRISEFKRKRRSTSIRLDLLEGEVFHSIRKLKRRDRYEVNTPTATAAVRGTKFVTRVRPRTPDATAEMVTTVTVLEGVVSVLDKIKGAQLRVNKDEQLQIDTLGAGSVETAPPAETQQIEKSFEMLTTAAAAPSAAAEVADQAGEVGDRVQQIINQIDQTVGDENIRGAVRQQLNDDDNDPF